MSRPAADDEQSRDSLIARMRRWQHAIGRAEVSRSEKSLLNAYLPFFDVMTGEAYPSTPRLAEYTKMDERTVVSARRRLVERGVLTVEAESGGGTRGGRGITHRVRLNIDALERLGSNPSVDQPPQTARSSTPGRLRPNQCNRHGVTPPNGRGEPSIHTPPREPTTSTAQPEQMRVDAQGGWMDGDVRRTLEQAGIRGPNLEQLAAAPGLTLTIIRAEWESITRSKRVRNPAAVLYHRLAKRAGIQPRGRSTLNLETLKLIADLEGERRRRGIA